MSFGSKTCLNCLSGRKVVGQSETQHSCLNLPLTLFSDNMVAVRISSWTKLKLTTTVHPKSDIFTKYSLRTSDFLLSLWKYFHLIYNKKGGGETLNIPYATGLNSRPTHPPTAEYSRASFIKHYPWSRNNGLDLRDNKQVIKDFEIFVDKPTCPRLLKTEYMRAKAQKLLKTVYVEPTNSNIPLTEVSENAIHDDDHLLELDLVVSAMNNLSQNIDKDLTYNGLSFDRGVDYEWDRRLLDNDKNLNGEFWMVYQLKFLLKFTGSSESNIKSCTLDSQFCLHPHSLHDSLTKNKRNELISKHKRVLLFIVDERSMLSNELVSACNKCLTQTMYGGVCENFHNFGNIPVVMIVGDDIQLPPVVIKVKGKGDFHMYSERPISYNNGIQMISEAFDTQIFRKLADNVMTLSKRTRQDGDNVMIDILYDLEKEIPSKNTARFLMSLHLKTFSSKFQESIKEKSIFISETHKDKDTYNSSELFRICSRKKSSSLYEIH